MRLTALRGRAHKSRPHTLRSPRDVIRDDANNSRERRVISYRIERPHATAGAVRRLRTSILTVAQHVERLAQRTSQRRDDAVRGDPSENGARSATKRN